MAVLVLPLLSWSSHSWGCWVIDRRSVVVSLPIVDVVGVPISSPGHAAPREQLLAAAVGLCRPILPPVIHPANGGEEWQWGSLFLLLVLIMLPISTPRAVARGGSWGCCRGVSSSLPFVVPLSTLQAARSGGVGVGGCRLVFRQLGELQCGRGFLPCDYPPSLGSLIPLM
jgi:hypothetical protein